MTQKIFLKKKARNYWSPREKGLENVPWSDFQIWGIVVISFRRSSLPSELCKYLQDEDRCC